MPIARNAIYRFGRNDGSLGLLRILDINIEENQAVIISLDIPNCWPDTQELSGILIEINLGQLQVIPVDEFQDLCDENGRTVTQCKKRDEHWKLIETIVKHPDVFNPRTRRHLVKARANETGSSRRKINRNLRRYWQRGQIPNALFPDTHKCGKNSQGGKGQKKRGRKSARLIRHGKEYGIVIDDNDKARMLEGINDHFLRKTPKLSLWRSYIRTMRDHYSTLEYRNENLVRAVLPPDQRPNWYQFKNFYYKKIREPSVQIIKREGYITYMNNYRPKLSDEFKQSRGAMDVSEYDSKTMDIPLAHSLDPFHIVGQPKVHVLVDVTSEAILGVYAGFGHTWEDASLSIVAMCEDKKELCDHYRLPYKPSEWLVDSELPRVIVADGGEFNTYRADKLPYALGVELITTQAYRGDQKGIIEKILHIINEELTRLLKGNYVSGLKRGEIDPRDRTVLNIYQFRRLLWAYVIYYNSKRRLRNIPLSKEMRKAGVRPFPAEIFRWSIQNQTGLPTSFDREIVQKNLLPDGEATVLQRGIKFKNSYYRSAWAEEQDWYTKAAKDGSSRVSVVYKPDNLETIYLMLDEGHQFEPATFIDRTRQEAYRGLDPLEVDIILKRELGEIQDSESKDMDATIEFEQFVESVQEEAREQVEPFLEGKTRSNRRSKQTEHRQMEREMDYQGILPESYNKPATASEDEPPVSEQNIPHNPIEKLRKLREERWDETE